MEIRYSCNQRDFKRYTTEETRKEFLIENLYAANEVVAVYSHVDRMVTLGCMPTTETVPIDKGIDIWHNFGTQYFLERREIGIFNIGGAGSITADGVKYELGYKDCLYITQGTKEVLFASEDAANPAKFYMVSAWLVWFGSALSALWILIANSWMQTPAGAELSADGSKAVITDFLTAAMNPSVWPRYSHTIVAVLIMGAFVAMAVSAWYLIKNRHKEFAMKTMKLGAVVGIVVSCVMLGTAHSSAVTVAEEQPTKLAMMEGMYDSEVPPLYAFGWVDEENQKVITPFSIPGGTSFLATGTWDTEYEGLNQLAASVEYGALDPETAPVNFVFQTYHIMVAMYGLIMLTVILALVFTLRGGKIQNMKWLQRLVLISPVFPLIAIQAGWFTAEVGRQPWVVYPSATSPEGVSLLTNEGVSQSVSAPELVITMVLFLVVYAFLMVAWARTMGRFIKEGPVAEHEPALEGAAAGKTPKGKAAPSFGDDLAKEGE